MKCTFCDQVATGTLIDYFHDRLAAIDASPCCHECGQDYERFYVADCDQDRARPTFYVSGLIFHGPHRVPETHQAIDLLIQERFNDEAENAD